MLKEIRARLYAFAFLTTLRRTAGITLASWLRLGLWILAGGLALAFLWPAVIVVLLLIFLLAVLYRQARRNGYATFTPLKQEPDVSHLPFLPGHKRLPVRATGMFSAVKQEHYVLLRPAECWHIPVDEHAIMVESGPRRYLYQFIQPDFLEAVQIGHFMFGSDHFPGLEITYHTDWSPQLNNDSIAYYVGGGAAGVGRLKRTIYLVFDQEEDWLLLWKSLVKRNA